VSAYSHEESRAAFERLFRETRSELLAYVARRSGSPEDAADVLAETYLIAWQKLEAIPPGDRARLWLFGVARNLLLKGASRRRSGTVLVERLAEELYRAHAVRATVDDERSDALLQTSCGCDCTARGPASEGSSVPRDRQSSSWPRPICNT
jgi:DNA-directed RNA polymerase specialized sigma24 family protein